MPTLASIDGFEHGVLSAAAVTSMTAGDRLYNAVVTTGGSIVSTGAQRFAGQRCFLCDSAAVGNAPKVTYAAESYGTPQRLIGRVLIYNDTWNLTNDQTFLYVTVGGALGARFRFANVSSARKIEATLATAAVVNSSVTLAEDTWYALDFELITNGTTWTLNWTVNGTAQTQITQGSHVATNIGTTELGHISATTGFLTRFDDLAFSVTSGDYPLPDMKVVGANPDGAGTHDLTGGNATFSWSDNSFTGSTNFTGTTDAAAVTRLDEFPAAGTGALTDTTFLRQTANSGISANLPTSNWAEFTYAHGSLSETPVAVRQVAAVRAASTTAAQLGIALNENGSNTVVSLAGDPSETSLVYWQDTHATKPSGGAWTNAALQNLRGRVFSSDTNPNPWVAAMMIEIAVPVVTLDPVSTGGAVAAGTAPGVRAAVARGVGYGHGFGALSADSEYGAEEDLPSGDWPIARVAVGTGGGVGGGNAPTEGGGTINDPVSTGGAVGAGQLGTGAKVSTPQGGAVGAGTAPAARAASTTGGALGAGAAPAVRVAAVPGGGLGAGSAPAARASVTVGGSVGGGNAPSEALSEAVGRGGAAGGGTSPGTSAAAAQGGGAGSSAPPVARVAVTTAGAAGGGTNPTANIVAPVTPGGAVGAGTAPAARTAVDAGGAAGGGPLTSGASVTVARGGAAGAGSGPAVTVAVGVAGAVGGGTNPAAPVIEAAGVGGAAAAGASPSAAVQVGQAGSAAAGAAPGARAGVAQGGAVGDGYSPSDGFTSGDLADVGGAVAGGNAAGARVATDRGSSLAGGASPTVRAAVGRGGALGAGTSPTATTTVQQGGATAAGFSHGVRVQLGVGGAAGGGNTIGEQIGDTAGRGGAIGAGTSPTAAVQADRAGSVAGGRPVAVLVAAEQGGSVGSAVVVPGVTVTVGVGGGVAGGVRIIEPDEGLSVVGGGIPRLGIETMGVV